MSPTKPTAMNSPSQGARDDNDPCPVYTTDAERFLPNNTMSPQWLVKSVDDEDDNKAIVVEMERRRRPYTTIQRMLLGPGTPPEVRPFRWLISYHALPKGYSYEHSQKGPLPPWRMLVRCFLVDVPTQLSDSEQITSIRSWKDYPVKKSTESHNRTQLDDAPPNITCGKRFVFSRQKHKTLCGDWLFVVYLWGADQPWIERIDVQKLLLSCNVFSIQAWEWADAKTPYMFYELRQGQDGSLLDTANDTPQSDRDDLAHLYDRSPERLSELRRIMNAQSRYILGRWTHC